MITVVLVVLILLMIWYISRSEHLVDPTIGPDPRSFYELTDGEKIQYIIDTYFTGPDEQTKTAAAEKKDKAYVQSLPEDANCADNYDSCAKWAANGECRANPEFMLYNCAGSCKACKLSPQEKYNLVKIYNRRDPEHCVFHADDTPRSYPSPERYVRLFESYYNENDLI